jgi:hypothetical protein
MTICTPADCTLVNYCSNVHVCDWGIWHCGGWQDIYPPIHLTDSDFAVITQVHPPPPLALDPFLLGGCHNLNFIQTCTHCSILLSCFMTQGSDISGGGGRGRGLRLQDGRLCDSNGNLGPVHFEAAFRDLLLRYAQRRLADCASGAASGGEVLSAQLGALKVDVHALSSLICRRVFVCI